MRFQLKIAIVTETYLPQINGVSTTLERLVSHLQAQGDSVHLLMPRYRDDPTRPQSGPEISEFGALPLPWYSEILLPFSRPAAIRSILRASNPDLVHIATEGPLGLAALLAAEKLRLPVISSFHTNFPMYLDSYRLGLIEKAAWGYLRWFHNRTAQTFCPTPSVRRILINKGFQRVGIWGRGVDSGRFSPDKRDPHCRAQLGLSTEDVAFVYCGRLAVEKNLLLLMEAFHRIRDPHARLLLIGDGPLRSQLAANAGQRVIFTGYRQGEELARLYASADIMVFPSRTETFGNVILEAMASGLPVIGFRTPGPQDIITDGLTGLLVAEPSAPALFRAMAHFLSHPEEIRRCGTEARTHARRQSWQQINEVLRRAYQESLTVSAPQGHRAAV
jgi:glycosyltransferase involved in cell wall biosynthesis